MSYTVARVPEGWAIVGPRGIVGLCTTKAEAEMVAAAHERLA